jgi:hypothetical protein
MTARRLLVIVCLLAIATMVIAARAATVNTKVEDVGSFACATPGATTTTVISLPAGGCSTDIKCAKRPDDPPHPNDDTCDGNNGRGNG